MAGQIGHLVSLANDSGRIDQVRVSFREVGELVLGVANRLVLGADRPVDVAEQRVGEALGFGEGGVVGGGVEADAEYAAVGFGE